MEVVGAVEEVSLFPEVSPLDYITNLDTSCAGGYVEIEYIPNPGKKSNEVKSQIVTKLILTQEQRDSGFKMASHSDFTQVGFSITINVTDGKGNAVKRYKFNTTQQILQQSRTDGPTYMKF